ncbi:MAG: imidazole glycerol phosphate synthase subunit HisH, partial [bacterium]
QSVAKALAAAGARPVVTASRRVVEGARALVVPGQGEFGAAMRRLRRAGLASAIRRAVAKGTPYLGICLGLQILFDRSEEAPGEPGLGVFRGVVRRFPRRSGLKVPHIGWNRVKSSGKRKADFYYFDHSYYADPEDRALVNGTADYGVTFCAAVRRGPVTAVQFHPEKSQGAGLAVLRSFVRSAC